jgi:hypothetical protein
LAHDDGCSGSARPNIIGRTITVNQSEYVVVGVTPEKYRGHVGGDSSSTHL